MKKRTKRRAVKEPVMRSARSNVKEDITIPIETKKQIAGFLLISFSLLLVLALVSYSEKDQARISALKDIIQFFREVFSSRDSTVNYLGLAGAIISDFLIISFLGYFTLIIPAILTIWGIVLIQKETKIRYIQLSVYLFLLMINLASITGLIKIFSGTESSLVKFCGTTGYFFATLLYQLFGGIGSSVIAAVSLVCLTYLLLDSNIIKSLAKLKVLWDKFRESLHKEKEDILQKNENSNLVTPDGIKIENSAFTSAGGEPEMDDALLKEKQKIQSFKFKKKTISAEDLPPVEPEDIIKKTEINRPKEPETVEFVDSSIEDLSVNKRSRRAGLNERPRRKKEVVSDQTDKDEVNNFDDIYIDKAKKESLSETDINPENDNNLGDLAGKDEDDFLEEKLDKYKLPPIDLLIDPTKEENESIPDEELTQNGRLLQEKLLKFGIKIEKVFATPGPVVTLYELIPAADVKLSKIESLQDDIALAMKARGIRMIIPMPGKGTVGVEIPNSKAQMVRFKSLVTTQQFHTNTMKLPLALGKNIYGDIYFDDLAKMPHLLIAGATGSGKSVGINTIIASLLYKMHPSDLKFVMIDPKKIELNLYSKLKKHYLATSTLINENIVTSPSNAVSILKSVAMEMEHRYDKLANAGVRNIDAYNLKLSEGKLKNTDVIRHKKMPYLVVIIDELADLMITAKKEIEEPIARIAQMARAVGIHLIVATQRPSTDVITGVIKANFPVRIAYQVASHIDSRTILDVGGAQHLLRNGDMLYLSSSSPKPIRIQNAFISTEECESIADFVGEQEGFKKQYLLPVPFEMRNNGTYSNDDRDEMFDEAARLIVKLNLCSTSAIQRRLKLGYARAARIVDQLEAAGIVGTANGAKGREVLVDEDQLERIL
ncbi:DNA translocase FtsK [soil metagenome]